jgi:septal ring factor EnvC (AmiA/AmiB activator)
MPDTDTETLLQRLKAMITQTTTDDDDEPTDLRGVRRELDRVREQRRKLAAEVAEIKTHVEELKKEHEKTLAKSREEQAAEVARIAAGYQEEQSLILVGVKHPDTIKRVREVYASLPPESRPKTPGEYAAMLQAAAKDPKKAETIPLDLRGHFPAAQVQAEAPPNTEQSVITHPADLASRIKTAKTPEELIAALSGAKA